VPAPVFRVACDVGGTFTDVAVLASDGRLAVFKTPTTPDDQGLAGITAGIEMATRELSEPGRPLSAGTSVFVHATTRPLNAILEGQTARTAFLTTRGHRDVLVLREGGRSSFRHHVAYPQPYVPRALTFEVPERVGPEGQVLLALDEDATRATLRELRDAEVEAIAVCLLWSVVNPAHEQAVGRLIEEELPGVPYSLSHRVNPIIREYRRASATAIDASLKPLISDYLARLEASLRDSGFDAEILCASCTGTMLPLADVAAAPIHAVQSGPALAPLAAIKVAAGAAADGSRGAGGESESIVVLDVGGTSSDVTVVDRGELPLTSEFWLGERFSGHLLGLPAVEVKSIGAGGGSIAWLDAGGLLRVGPHSAGATPGPACYGNGGTEPTVTDAALVLGYLNPDYFLGGQIPLAPATATEAVTRAVAEPLGMDAVAAADAIFAVAIQQMTDAIEEITVSRGMDPRDAVIVAGGGAAGFAIDRVARELGVRAALIPRAAPVLAAYGGSVSPLACDFRRTHLTDTTAFDYAGVNALLTELEAEAEAFLADRVHEPGTSELAWYVGARYGHQRWEIEVPLGRSRFSGTDDVAALAERFHALHARLYAVSDDDQYVECVTWRVRAGHRPEGTASVLRGEETAAPARNGSRAAYFRDHGWLDATVIGGSALTPGTQVRGPALIEEPATTIVIAPGSVLEVGTTGDFRLTPGPSINVSDRERSN
jgi:N-methylhydantoinase A